MVKTRMQSLRREGSSCRLSLWQHPDHGDAGAEDPGQEDTGVPGEEQEEGAEGDRASMRLSSSQRMTSKMMTKMILTITFSVCFICLVASAWLLISSLSLQFI